MTMITNENREKILRWFKQYILLFNLRNNQNIDAAKLDSFSNDMLHALAQILSRVLELQFVEFPYGFELCNFGSVEEWKRFCSDTNQLLDSMNLTLERITN